MTYQCLNTNVGKVVFFFNLSEPWFTHHVGDNHMVTSYAGRDEWQDSAGAHILRGG